jgi:NAD(P)-dependent dehydrogenase (short-subunit alcohol dehydrogenase family)
MQIVTPLNPATREQENLDNWMDKNKSTPLGRIGQVWQMGVEGHFVAFFLLLIDTLLTHSEIPIHFIAQPSECGPSYVFLASQESSYMTGQVLHVDGGMFVTS